MGGGGCMTVSDFDKSGDTHAEAGRPLAPTLARTS